MPEQPMRQLNRIESTRVDPHQVAPNRQPRRNAQQRLHRRTPFPAPQANQHSETYRTETVTVTPLPVTVTVTVTDYRNGEAGQPDTVSGTP
jgi:hypothetical protein